MIRWRVYYGDDSTLDNTQCSVFDLPTRNVQAIVQFDEHVGREVLHFGTAYAWHDDEQLWYRIEDQFGFDDYLFDLPGPKKVLKGRTIDRASYKRILKNAIEDSDFTGVLNG